ncbi:RHS repeat-associated core domain-containing protein [Streptomyces sp. NPDC001621]|uniref:RHS repeat-associated core domain-containing protein n=1 Tax=Streptomyces sp. NPDC001621 TaxID=3364594 RepID=UPI0036CEDA9B
MAKVTDVSAFAARSGTLPTGTSNGFLGKTEDTSTGLSLLGARAYDARLGRFLSTDPLSAPYDPQDLSAYTYSRNNPVNYADPSGLAWVAPNGEKCGHIDQCHDTGGNGNNDSTTTVTDLGNGEAPPSTRTSAGGTWEETENPPSG